MKPADTEVEHRRVAGLEVKSSLFDFPEVRNEARGELPLRAEKCAEVRQQLCIRQIAEFHRHGVPRRFSASLMTRCDAITHGITSRGVSHTKARWRST
jgi:hypothetical protein